MGVLPAEQKTFLIDANIFLEVIFQRKQQVVCRRLLHAIFEDEIRAVVPAFSVHGIEAYLSRRGYPHDVRDFLLFLERSLGITVFATTIKDEQRILELTTTMSLDFDDALHYYIAKTFNLTLVSLDKDFDATDLLVAKPHQFF